MTGSGCLGDFFEEEVSLKNSPQRHKGRRDTHLKFRIKNFKLKIKNL